MAERLLGPYRLMETLSEHASGALWRAWDTQLNRRVLVRRLPRLDRTNEDGGVLFKAFLQDVRQLTRLRHPSLLPPVGFSPPHAAEAWYATEFVDHPNLRVLVSTVGLLPWVQGLLILGQLADALAYAHEQGAVHGSVSPTAVLLDPRGRVLLTDFNLSLAALVRTNVAAFEGLSRVVDDRSYVAPEVLRLRPPSPAADIFSLGVVAFEMFTGARPFPDAAAVRAHGESRHAPTPDPWDVAGHLPPTVRDLVREMLASAPEDRPANMGVVAARAAEGLEPEDRAEPTDALRASFARQSMVFGNVAALDEEDPARRKTSPMMPVTELDDTGGGPVPRRETVPGLPGSGQAPAKGAQADGPKRRKTDRFAPPEPKARGVSGGSAGSRGRPSAATRALRVLEREGYLKAPSRPERDSTRAIAVIMALALAAVVGVWFVLLQAGPRRPGPPAPAAQGEGALAAERAAGATSRGADAEAQAPRAPAPPEDPVDIARAKAEALLAAKNPARAAAEARAGLAIDPDDPALRRLLIDALVALGDHDGAVAALVELDERAGATAWRGHARAAALRLQEQRYAEARELLQEALDRGADDPDLWLSLARCERALDKPRRAADALSRYLSERPDDAAAVGQLAALRERLGDAPGALAAYRHLLALRPGDPAATAAVLRLGGASALDAAMRAGGATGQGSQPGLAATPETWEAMGYAALKAQRYGQAIRALSRAVQARRAAGTAVPWAVLSNLALALDKAGKPGEAAKVYERVLQRQPARADVAELLGRALLRAGRDAAGERALERAATLDPSRWKARFTLGRRALERGDWEAAERAFRAVLAVVPGQPESLQNLGKAQIERQDYAGALATFQQLGRARPADPQPVLTVAKLLTMMHRAADAAPWWAEACRRGAREACQRAPEGPPTGPRPGMP